MKDQLHIVKGNRIINIRGTVGLKNEPQVLITVTEDWHSRPIYDEDEDDFFDEEDESESASFYLEPDDIDAIILKLKEAKEYLNTIKP